MQDFNNKFLEFAHTNTNSAFDFVQRLHGVKSPSELMELSTEHTRNQIQAITDKPNSLWNTRRGCARDGGTAQNGCYKSVQPCPVTSVAVN